VTKMDEQKNIKFRHEYKYVISSAELQMLRNRLNHMLSIDSHAGAGGFYHIRSLYFDDYHNSCYYENENGTDPREKFRIRIYNHSLDRIVLECKRKERGKTLKTSCPLTIEQTQMLIHGKILPSIGEQPPLLRKLTMKMMTQGFHPVVIVEYDRIPYVYKNGNVRITLDTNLFASDAVHGFLHPKIIKWPVMPVGQQLLEVKYDAYLPDFVYQNLQLQNLRQTAFSKYYVCRKYTK